MRMSWPAAAVWIALIAVWGGYELLYGGRAHYSVECAKIGGIWSNWWGGYCYKK